jgi:hypothetical protein
LTEKRPSAGWQDQRAGDRHVFRGGPLLSPKLPLFYNVWAEIYAAKGRAPDEKADWLHRQITESRSRQMKSQRSPLQAPADGRHHIGWPVDGLDDGDAKRETGQ